MLIKEKIKILIALKKEMIIKLLFLAFGGFFFSLGWISINRLVVFIVILLIIYVYKILIEKAKNSIVGAFFLYLLIVIDRVKILHIKLVIGLYVLLFDLSECAEEGNKYIVKLIKLIEWLLKILLINPILLISYKFYYLLYILSKASLKELIFKRLYGLIITILIFLPFYIYIYIMLNACSIYIVIVIISILDDNSLNISKLKYISWKDITVILEYRNITSILAVLIKNNASAIATYNKGKINKHAFEVNYIYRNVFIGCLEDGSEYFKGKFIIDYDSLIKFHKVIKLSIVKDYSLLLKSFHIDLEHSLFVILEKIIGIKHYDLQVNARVGPEDLAGVEKLQEFNCLLVKLFLYFHWNTLKLVNETNEFLNGLVLVNGYPFIGFKEDHSYAYMPDNQLIEISQMIRSSDFITYRSYYEQVYVHSQLWEFCYIGPTNVTVNFNKYTLHINNYLLSFLYNVKAIKLEKAKPYISNSAVPCSNCNNCNEINLYLAKFKDKLIEEWKRDCSDVNQSNYYEKNFIPLNQLNEYIKKK